MHINSKVVEASISASISITHRNENTVNRLDTVTITPQKDKFAVSLTINGFLVLAKE